MKRLEELPYSGNLLKGENFRELLKVGLLRLKLSRIVGNNNETPIDNDAVVLNKNFRC